ncbi:hypothetical protein TWF506_003240 [Arthrobotrys conoides]|uniref:Uncharacterized protein n=1 Tax=Arthrobotrys conoides TaxID=74498 RepID=A0AAN8RRK9_9PEZI
MIHVGPTPQHFLQHSHHKNSQNFILVHRNLSTSNGMMNHLSSELNDLHNCFLILLIILQHFHDCMNLNQKIGILSLAGTHLYILKTPNVGFLTMPTLVTQSGCGGAQKSKKVAKDTSKPWNL